jgi:hypothetical protein
MSFIEGRSVLWDRALEVEKDKSLILEAWRGVC